MFVPWGSVGPREQGWMGGPSLDPYYRLRVGWFRGRGPCGRTRKPLSSMARAVRGRAGSATAHFPCRLGVGMRVSETCTPAQEEMGLKLFDLKPPLWCLVQFLKMEAHLSEKGTGKNYSKNT